MLTALPPILSLSLSLPEQGCLAFSWFWFLFFHSLVCLVSSYTWAEDTVGPCAGKLAGTHPHRHLQARWASSTVPLLAGPLVAAAVCRPLVRVPGLLHRASVPASTRSGCRGGVTPTSQGFTPAVLCSLGLQHAAALPVTCQRGSGESPLPSRAAAPGSFSLWVLSASRPRGTQGRNLLGSWGSASCSRAARGRGSLPSEPPCSTCRCSETLLPMLTAHS